MKKFDLKRLICILVYVVFGFIFFYSFNYMINLAYEVNALDVSLDIKVKCF